MPTMFGMNKVSWNEEDPTRDGWMTSGYNKTDDGRVERSNKREDWLAIAHHGCHQKLCDLTGHHIFLITERRTNMFAILCR